MMQGDLGNKRRVLLPHRLLGNIYVLEVGRAYRELGCEVVFGPENLFESNLRPDIVHLNWPEELFRGFGTGSVEQKAERLFAKIREYRRQGVKIVWTVHNEKPHESAGGNVDADVYQFIVNSADVIHHHCECSRELLSRRYEVPSSVRQFIAPHGHYFSYANDVSRVEARRKLGIARDAFVYLHFGAIRGYKGIDRVLTAFRRVRQSGDVLLVAGRKSGTDQLRERLRFAYHRSFSSSMRFHFSMIDSDDIQLYVNAANALVLGHSDGLNSGVAILGMTFGRVVIGPRLGCISSVLDQGINLTYGTGDLAGLISQLKAAKEIDAAEVERCNQEAARKWRWTNIARPVLEDR